MLGSDFDLLLTVYSTWIVAFYRFRFRCVNVVDAKYIFCRCRFFDSLCYCLFSGVSV